MTIDPQVLEEYFAVTASEIDFKPNHNVAPGQEAPVIFSSNGTRQLKLMRWGLVPHWAKDPKIGYKTINARAETIAQKPSYRDGLERRRCLIPADGFYEWKKSLTGRAKTPHRFSLKGNAPFAFAGLWDRWIGTGGEPSITSFTIVTTEANALVSPIHDRMPVILSKSNHEIWLDPQTADPTALLRPYPASEMSFLNTHPN